MKKQGKQEVGLFLRKGEPGAGIGTGLVSEGQESGYVCPVEESGGEVRGGAKPCDIIFSSGGSGAEA